MNAAVGHILVYQGQKTSPVVVISQAWPLRSLGQRTGLKPEREVGWVDGYTGPRPWILSSLYNNSQSFSP